MANNDGGGIYYEVELDASNMLSAAQKAKDTLDDIGSSASGAGKRLDSLQSDLRSVSQSSNQVANNTGKLASGMDTLNTSVSGVAQAIQQAVAIQNMQTISLAQLNAGMNSLVAAANSMASAMASAGSSTTTSTQSYTRAESAIEGLGNQIAILEEANENGARSAAILAAQLRLGADASDAQKAEIAQLTGTLYDMKNGVDTGGKSVGSWKSQMQQAGYQVQDFIVQVQGGQSALVAFAQQGSQLAGAFGPSGAIIGALIALGSVVAGTIIKSMGDATDTVDTLKSAIQDFDNVISISNQGVATLSDKYALLAQTNTQLATILRNQAAIELKSQLDQLPKTLDNVSDSTFSFGEVVKATFTGGLPSISLMDSNLKSLGITTDDYNQALSELAKNGSGQARQVMIDTASTTETLAQKFNISNEEAFKLSQQLGNIKSPDDLQRIVGEMQQVILKTNGSTTALQEFLKPLVKLLGLANQAKGAVDANAKSTNQLTTAQQNLLDQSKQTLKYSSLEGKARAEAIALDKAHAAGLSETNVYQKQVIEGMVADAGAAYDNNQAQKQLTQQRTKSNSAAKQQANAEQSVQQKLDQLRQQSDLNAVSSQNLTLEQAKLRAEMSLGKNATEAQRKEAAAYAETIWQQAAALKARNLIPELAENDDYTNKTAQLNMLKGQKDTQGNLIISQEQYQQESEKLATDHAVAIAKIGSENVVTPKQQAAGTVDPVQQLENQHKEQLQLISNFENAGVLSHDRAIALKNAADTAYQKNLVNAQWALFTQQSEGYQMLGSAVDAMSQSASSAISGVITGSESLTDALGNISNAVINSVVQSFVDMGVQWVKSAIMGQNAQVAAIGATTAAQTAGIGTTTVANTAAAAESTAAWTPAALVASIGSFGGAAAIGLGALVGVMALTSSLSKRKNGGPVTSGSMYQVGESNKPEIYQTSTGSQYMIPGDGGKVLNQNQMGSGSSGTNVNVYNYASSQVQTKTRTDNGQQVLDIMINDMQTGGPYHQAMQGTYGLSAQAQGDY